MNIPFFRRYPTLSLAVEWLLKITIFVLLAWAIYHQVFQNKDIHVIKQQLLLALHNHYGLVAMVLLLMLMNWGVEALKWQLLVAKVEIISYLKSLVAIFCGVTFTMFTPNRMGEYGGRFLLLKEPLRPAAFQATVLGSVAQIITTLLFGSIGLVCYFQSDRTAFGVQNAFGFLWIIVAIPMLLSVYFSADVILAKLPFQQRWKQISFAWAHYTDGELWTVLMLAIFRFAIYTLQYLLLLQVFIGAGAMSLRNAANVCLVFLVQTVVPSIALLDLGIRGKAALAILANDGNAAGVLAATFCLWLINLVMPAIIGAVLILGRRIFTTAGGANLT